MWEHEGSKYQPVNTLANEEANPHENDFRVSIEGRINGRCTFRLGREKDQAVKNVSRQTSAHLKAGKTCFRMGLVFILPGLLYMGVYGTLSIREYANSPIQNCTVLEVYPSPYSMNYEVQFQLLNSDINGSMSISTKQFHEGVYQNGSFFTCIHKGGYLVAYKIIQKEYKMIKILWPVGGVVSSGFLFYFVLFFLGFSVCASFIPSVISYTYYSPETSYTQDTQLVIDSWGPLPVEVHQQIYMCLRTYYKEVESPRSTVNISFKSVSNFKQTVALAFGCFFYLVGFFAALFAVAITPIWMIGPHYQATSYLFGSFQSSNGVVAAAFAAFIIWYTLKSRRFTVETDKLRMEVTIVDTTNILGHIYKLTK